MTSCNLHDLLQALILNTVTLRVWTSACESGDTVQSIAMVARFISEKQHCWLVPCSLKTQVWLCLLKSALSLTPDFPAVSYGPPPEGTHDSLAPLGALAHCVSFSCNSVHSRSWCSSSRDPCL